MYCINIIYDTYSKPASGKMLKICIYLRKVRLKRAVDRNITQRFVKQSALSKSKISLLLTKMNDDGKIIKIKKGNIIRLVKEKLE